MRTDLKLCRQCKHGRDIGRWESLWGCINPLCGAKIDVVDGGQMYARCSHARSADGACGVDGKYWEKVNEEK